MATLVEDEDEKGRLVIHGEEMEGGGQILRISSVIAAIWNKKVVIQSIRGKRKKPGLRPQVS